jgi:hypothetical protein
MNICFVLPSHMGVFKENSLVAALLKHQFSYLRIATQGAAAIPLHPRFIFGPAFTPGKIIKQTTRSSGGYALGKASMNSFDGDPFDGTSDRRNLA